MVNEKPKEKRVYGTTIIPEIFLIVLIVSFGAIIFIAGSNDRYNYQFKKEFCQNIGFDKYENETCIKLDNEKATITQIYCIREPEPNEGILDLGKTNKCREVIN